MNKNILFSIILIFSFGLLNAQNKQISLEEIWKEYKFYPSSPLGFNFMKAGNNFSRMEGNNIFEYDIVSGEKISDIFSANKTVISGYEFSANESKLLLETNPEKIYRYSSKADFIVFDRKDKSSKKLSDQGKQSSPEFNSNADKVAFVRDNNIFIKDLSKNNEIQVTRDGQMNRIINGMADWVYEEEFSFTKAFSWSPDGSKIAFMRFDESNVKEFTMTYFVNRLYPIESKFKYPKAGEENAIVSVHIYDLKSKKTSKVDLGVEKDQYVPRIFWAPDGELCIFKLNRHQNKLIILKSDSKGKTKKMLSEENKYFIDINDYITFTDSDKFLWLSDQDGFTHIYLHNLCGEKIKQLTQGDWDITKFYGYDPKAKKAFFQAAKEKSYNREIYSVEIESGKIEKLSSKEGENNAQFSSNFQYFVNEHSSIYRPSTYSLIKVEDKSELRVLEDNSALVELLNQYEFGQQNYFSFKNDDGIELNGWMMLPPNFDASKKYPVFMYVYGGPSSPTATNQWDSGNGTWFRMLTQKGYIVVTVDGRGTEPRGEAFRKATYMQLGKYEAIDQIAAARYLGSLPYVNKNRIGIFGWSFGGYLSSLCLAKGNDVFKMAIAVAPVTNWKWYDTIYTERYMRTPAENLRGYEDNSPINFAGDIKGKYLLVHGLGDDNVHFQHAAEMSRVLMEKNVQFEQLFYPNKNHGIYGGLTRLHLYTKMTDFILKNL